MANSMVRAHTRNGYFVKAHSRRTRDRMLDIERDPAPLEPYPVNNDCPHPAWYPIRHIESGRLLTYCCTDCAASRPAEGEAK